MLDCLPCMRRLVLILVTVLLPLQLAWAAAAAYCQHEGTSKSATHFGHHQHVHDADQVHTKLPGGKVVGDYDCGYCNTVTAAVLPDFDAPPSQSAVLRRHGLPPEQERPSAPQRAPDRPQWLRLA